MDPQSPLQYIFQIVEPGASFLRLLNILSEKMRYHQIASCREVIVEDIEEDDLLWRDYLLILAVKVKLKDVVRDDVGEPATWDEG